MTQAELLKMLERVADAVVADPARLSSAVLRWRKWAKEEKKIDGSDVE